MHLVGGLTGFCASPLTQHSLSLGEISIRLHSPAALHVWSSALHAPGGGTTAIKRHYDGGTAATKRHYGRRRRSGPHPGRRGPGSAAAAATSTARPPPEGRTPLLLSAGKAP